MGDAIFLLSGITTLIITGIFIYVLSWFAPDRIRWSAPILTLSLSGLFIVINILYFSNLIPPIPLALKEAGVYREIVKVTDGVYETFGEEQEWFKFLEPNPKIHVDESRSLYMLSAVFAPVSLSTEIVHVWQRYDKTTRSWVSTSRVELRIEGGRENGYRTFSQSTNISPGRWRVNVETPRGQLIGRLSFEVASSTGEEALITDIQ